MLIIFVIGIVQDVQAQNAISGTLITHDFSPNGNLNSKATCTSLVDGIWNENTKTCTIPDNGRALGIGDGTTLVIDAGYTLVVSNTGKNSIGIFFPTSISGGGQITNNGIIIISNSGEHSQGIWIGKPSLITNNGIILITNSAKASFGIYTTDYIGCSYAIQAYTGGCATSLINNGDIIIANTNPPSSSKWDQSNGIYGGKIIDKGTIRVMTKADAYKELDARKALDDKKDNTKKIDDDKKALEEKKVLDDKKALEEKKVLDDKKALDEKKVLDDVKKIKIESFVDPKKDPQSYVKRYQNEPTYKTWFDKNYGSKYKSIYEAVGLPEPTKITTNTIQTNNQTKSKLPSWIKDRALLFGEGKISENEFLKAIQFLVDNGIVKSSYNVKNNTVQIPPFVPVPPVPTPVEHTK